MRKVAAPTTMSVRLKVMTIFMEDSLIYLGRYHLQLHWLQVSPMKRISTYPCIWLRQRILRIQAQGKLSEKRGFRPMRGPVFTKFMKASSFPRKVMAPTTGFRYVSQDWIQMRNKYITHPRIRPGRGSRWTQPSNLSSPMGAPFS
jgi:hypothetical protein